MQVKIKIMGVVKLWDAMIGYSKEAVERHLNFLKAVVESNKDAEIVVGRNYDTSKGIS